MTSKEIAAQILELVGKESNIISCTHCVTRLRFSLKDDGKADRKKIESLEGVLGVQIQGGQFQVIVCGTCGDGQFGRRRCRCCGRVRNREKERGVANFRDPLFHINSQFAAGDRRGDDKRLPVYVLGIRLD